MNLKNLATKDLFLLIAGILGGVFIKGLFNLIVFGIIIYLLAQVINFISSKKSSTIESNR